jgi:hypothetical protein
MAFQFSIKLQHIRLIGLTDTPSSSTSLLA